MDFDFGSLDRRHLKVRVFSPWYWWRPNFHHTATDFWFNPKWGPSRCYCVEGSGLTLRISVFGYGFVLWYSNYTGELPCSCDVVMDEIFPENAPHYDGEKRLAI